MNSRSKPCERNDRKQRRESELLWPLAAVEATGYYPPEFAYMAAKRWKSHRKNRSVVYNYMPKWISS